VSDNTGPQNNCGRADHRYSGTGCNQYEYVAGPVQDRLTLARLTRREIRIRLGFDDLLCMSGRVRGQKKQTLVSIEHAKSLSLSRNLPEIEGRGLNEIDNLLPAAKELFQ
jgi:hypothetical protein